MRWAGDRSRAIILVPRLLRSGLDLPVSCRMILVAPLRGHHVLPHQGLRPALLPPDRREPLGGRAVWGGGGPLDQRGQPGRLDALLPPGARLSRSVLLLPAHVQGQLPTITTRRIGPALIFERLWLETGCRRVIEHLLDGRRFGFDVERAVFLTVLHRLFAPGSDRAADKWKADYQIEGCEALQLHHLYRAMAWLGERLPPAQQPDKAPSAPRCTKARVEEGLFARRRDLFTGLQLVFFDTTSLYFEGNGGQEIGQRGYSKDHRPDLYQMIVGVVLDGR